MEIRWQERSVAAGQVLRQSTFWASIVLILALSLLCAYSLQQLLHAGDAADHARNVRYEVQELLSRLKDAETGQRNYLVTGDDAYLAEYGLAPDTISFGLRRLFELTGETPDQQRRLMRLRALIEEHLDLLRDGIEARRGEGFAAAADPARLTHSKLAMDEIRALTLEIVNAENAVYDALKERARHYAGVTVVASMIGFVLAATSLGLLFHWMNGEIRRRRHAEATLETLNRRLHKLNAGLEARTEARTADLAQANAHLAAVVTERERMAETLRQAKEMLEAIIDAAPFAIIGLDPEQRVMVWNRAAREMFGYAAEEVVGQPYPLVPEDARADFDALLSRIAAGEWLKDIEVRRQRKDGTILDVRSAGAPLYDASGRIRGAVYALEDVTQAKLMERQLRHAQRLEAVGALTGGLAHDFNNLLAIVIGNLDMLQDELADKPQAQELHRNALAASLRGADLTRQLLAFARRQPLAPRVFGLNDLVSETVTLLRRTLDEKIEIDMSLACDLWPVEADPTQVESALTNLAINARDAMPGGGKLTIETANKHLDAHYAAENVEVTPGDYVMLAVSDTGTGIPPEILDRVCEPFFTTKASGKGSGLGLAMIYGFAKQSGGHVKIYSEIDHGTTVRLYLPRAESEAAAAVDTAAASEVAEPASATILVVEDNANVRNIVVKQLKELGYRVEEANDAAAALTVLKEGPPIDLLFTDIVMPGGMTGNDLAGEARKLRPDIKILLTSGFAETAVQNGGRSRERMDLLSKPYRKQELARKVQEILLRE